jgi:peptidyl-prolyl cis-trans isomerase B (cyclophilin B)
MARQRALRQAQRRVEQRQRRKRIALLGSGVAATLGIVAGGLALAGAFSSSPKKAAAAAHPSTSPTPTPTASATPSASPTPFRYAGSCDVTASTTGANPRKPGLPPGKPAHTTGTETFTMSTSAGTIAFTGDAAKAPCTTSALAYLASKKYFDNTICHRLTTGTGLKVLQCGDPAGDGTGGPGWTMPEENLTAASYGRGVVAMAKTSATHSTGSQFFLVYGASQLPAEYTVLGHITKGQDVLDAIAKKGVKGGGSDGAPAETVKVKTLTARWSA